MARSTHLRRLRATALALVLMLSAALLQVSGATLAPGKSLVIEPASTWAGIARVYLEIENLQLNGEELEGTYQIRVPLSPRKNDTGRILLRTSAPIDGSSEKLATATGSAVSSSGQVNPVVARMEPGGVVRIQVVTPRRTLQFTSKFASR